MCKRANTNIIFSIKSFNFLKMDGKIFTHYSWLCDECVPPHMSDMLTFICIHMYVKNGWKYTHTYLHFCLLILAMKEIREHLKNTCMTNGSVRSGLDSPPNLFF